MARAPDDRSSDPLPTNNISKVVKFTHLWPMYFIIIIIIILSFDIAPFPYKHAQRRITFHCQRIDFDIHIVN